jgi:hypothetical protein
MYFADILFWLLFAGFLLLLYGFLCMSWACWRWKYQCRWWMAKHRRALELIIKGGHEDILDELTKDNRHEDCA